MPSPSSTRKTLSDLKASILNPALTSSYQCWFQPFNVAGNGNLQRWFSNRSDARLGNYSSSQDEFISLSCSEAVLPGSSLATHEINNDFCGVTERHAYRRQYDDRASFTFYVDHDYEIIHYFENWMAFIVNEQRTDSEAFGPGVSKYNYSYRINFPKDYQADIYVNKFEKDYFGRTLQYKFLQAYPISIDSMPVSYQSSQLFKCTVSFTYTRYISETKILTDPFSDTIIGPGLTPEPTLGANDLPGNITSTSPIA